MPSENLDPSGDAALSSRDFSFNRRLSILVVLSFIIVVIAVVLRLGIGATPYETTDSAGRPMGFNDPLGWEHYLIMVGNFRPASFLSTEYAYTWLLIALQAVGASLLLGGRKIPVRITRCFFAAQAVLFPVGLFFCWTVPLMIIPLLGVSNDREGFIDIPYIIWMSQTTWVLTSLLIAVLLRGPSLGLARVWRAVKEGFRAGGRRFVEVVR